MQTKQTLIIIGATGNMGSAISKNLSKGNYRLLLQGRNHTKLRLLEQDIRNIHPSADLEIINCSYDGCWEADIIIAAIPFQAEKDVARKILEVATQKIVISMANPLNETHDGLLTAPNTSAAEELQKLLPNSKIIKAFNTTLPSDFSQTQVKGKQVNCFIAGNDEEALQTVSELARTAGFNPVLTGDLSVSRGLEKKMTGLKVKV